MTVLTPPGYTQGGTYTAKLDRVYLATLGKIPNLGASFSARQGFFGGRVPVYANPSGMDITVGACGAVVANTFAAASGDYLMANDATVQVTLAASSPTLNRHDIIGFQIKDNLFDSSGLNSAIPAVIQGSNSAGTPSDPVLPASFIPVVRAVVNATDTSPSALQSLIRKTAEDGGLVRIANVTERAEITPHEGLGIYREDHDWPELHDGTAWRVAGWVETDDLSKITNPRTNQLALLTTDLILYRWNGSAWVLALPISGTTAATRHEAHYFQSGTPQSIPNNSDQRVLFNSNNRTTNDITTANVSGGTVFQLQRACWVDAHVNVKFAGGANDSERYIGLANHANLNQRYAQNSAPSNTASAALPIALSCSVGRPFPALAQLTVVAFQSDIGAVSLDNAFVEDINISLSIRGL